MKADRARKTSRELSPRRAPLQKRSVERNEQILQVTAALLDAVGFDALTTILIAEESGINAMPVKNSSVAPSIRTERSSCNFS